MSDDGPMLNRFPDHINRDGSGVWLESDLHAENDRLRAELKSWRDWSGFVFVNNKPLFDKTDAELRAAICKQWDDSLTAERNELSALKSSLLTLQTAVSRTALDMRREAALWPKTERAQQTARLLAGFAATLEAALLPDTAGTKRLQGAK